MVYPLAITTLDPTMLKELFREETRKADARRVSLTQLNNFHQMLKNENKINDLNIFHATFYFEIGDVRDLLDLSYGSVNSYRWERNVLLLSGTFLAWKHFLIENTGSEISEGLRRDVNLIYHYFNQIGFGFMWNGLTKEKLPDGTWSIKSE